MVRSLFACLIVAGALVLYSEGRSVCPEGELLTADKECVKTVTRRSPEFSPECVIDCVIPPNCPEGQRPDANGHCREIWNVRRARSVEETKVEMKRCPGGEDSNGKCKTNEESNFDLTSRRKASSSPSNGKGLVYIIKQKLFGKPSKRPTPPPPFIPQPLPDPDGSSEDVGEELTDLYRSLKSLESRIPGTENGSSRIVKVEVKNGLEKGEEPEDTDEMNRELIKNILKPELVKFLEFSEQNSPLFQRFPKPTSGGDERKRT